MTLDKSVYFSLRAFFSGGWVSGYTGLTSVSPLLSPLEEGGGQSLDAGLPGGAPTLGEGCEARDAGLC